LLIEATRGAPSASVIVNTGTGLNFLNTCSWGSAKADILAGGYGANKVVPKIPKMTPKRIKSFIVSPEYIIAI
jgi:hypothetical protein